MKSKTQIVFVLWAGLTLVISGCQKTLEFDKTGTVKVTFRNTVKGAPLALNTGIYTNPFSESYTVSKFKYYISNVGIDAVLGSFSEQQESYHLIDAVNPASLSFSFPANIGVYQSVTFMLGVDSLRNVSGAQTGALDPTNDMFWTWNSGYIMAKFEGNSPASAQVNNKVEYHIGGFSGANSVLKTLTLLFPSGKQMDIREGQMSEIFIDADFDQWWQNPNDLKITDNPVCTTPGALAKQIADNYSKMFTVTDVINY
ncbi:MAG: hypothetical protein IPP31_01550 [Chitinophagaceae bacterium]|nr:hypothetical protein [Chitinophagaceae bacterium]